MPYNLAVLHHFPKIVQQCFARARPTYNARLQRWQHAEISGHRLRVIRNDMLASGIPWPQTILRDRMDDGPQKKKIRRALAQAERLKTIQRNMEQMPEKIAEYRKEKRERKMKKKEQKARRRALAVEWLKKQAESEGQTKKWSMKKK